MIIDINGFTMVFGSNGFIVRRPLDTIVFQWFPMVAYHWSDDGMVTIHRSGLLSCLVVFVFTLDVLVCCYVYFNVSLLFLPFS